MNELTMLLADGKVEMLFNMCIVPLVAGAIIIGALDFTAWEIRQIKRRRRRASHR